jgi:hypothetical protein
MKRQAAAEKTSGDLPHGRPYVAAAVGHAKAREPPQLPHVHRLLRQLHTRKRRNDQANADQTTREVGPETEAHPPRT